MSIQKKPTSRYPKVLSLLAIGSIAGVFGAVGPAEARVVDARQALEARVFTVRAAIEDRSKVDSGVLPDPAVAQWYNWGNWGNWNNWPNWGNWGNWFNR